MNLVNVVSFLEEWGLVLIVAPPIILGWYQLGCFVADLLFT